MNRSHYTLALLAGTAVVIGAIAFAVLHRHPDKDDALRKLALDTNDTLPRKAGPLLALVHVALERDTWRVDYRYDDAVVLDAAGQARLKDATLKSVCGGAMWHALHRGYSIAVRYRFKDGGDRKSVV